jgi:hypothetical protein
MAWWVPSWFGRRGWPLINTLHQSGGNTGVYLAAAGASARGNAVYANSTGINAYGYNRTVLITVRGTVFNNSSTGICAQYSTLVTGNTAYGQSSIGIVAYYGAQASQNVVYITASVGHGVRIACNKLKAHSKSRMTIIQSEAQCESRL